MNKKNIFISSIIILLLILWMFIPTRMKLDGALGTIMSINVIEDTEYTEGYSDDKFYAISIGMKEKDLLELIGEPFLRYNPSSKHNKQQFEILKYSRSPGDTHYRIRLVFVKDKIVIKTESSFYFD